jgi:MYXO-CTERM domain-containing protein
VNLAGSTAADFDLVSGSPAIDAGSASGRSPDFLNRTAPAGSAMDIGAFEFGSSLAAGLTTPIPANVAVNGCSTTGGTSSTGGTSATGGTATNTGGTATNTGGTATNTGGTATNTGGTNASGGTGGQPGTETCNCRMAGEPSGSGRGPVGLLALVATVLFRRRRLRKVSH